MAANTFTVISSPSTFAGRLGRLLLAGAVVSTAFIWHSTAQAGGRADQIAGAIVGAGFGAVIGQQIGGRDGAVIGGAIGAATGAAAAGHHRHHGQRVYRTQRPGPQHGYPHRQPRPVVQYGNAYGHAPWVGSLAAPQVIIVNPPVRGYQPPRVVYHHARGYRNGHGNRIHRGHRARAQQRAYRRGFRDGARMAGHHRY